jgi:uncharacterized RDD family membrane protein YckC
MKRWYLTENGARAGPFSDAEIFSFLAEGRLHQDSLVSCDSMPGELPVSRIPDFQPSPYAPPATVEAGDMVWDGYTSSGSQVRPWVRFWARSFDLSIFGSIAYLVLEITAPAVLGMNDTVFQILCSAAAIPVEAALFAGFGNTPCKALLNVRVRNRDGSKLGFSRALRRSFGVWLLGEGIGIPIASLMANIVAYRRLMDRGTTTWDARHGFTVSHRPIEGWRILVIIAIVAGLISLIVIGAVAPAEP